MLFRSKNTSYVSETTQFLRDLLKHKPHIVEEQRKGRSLWWDKQLDLEMLRRAEQSRVALPDATGSDQNAAQSGAHDAQP